MDREWDNMDIETKTSRITGILQKTFEASILKKKKSEKGKTLPKWLLEKIKKRKQKKGILTRLRSETVKRDIEIIDKAVDGVTNIKRRWDNEQILRIEHKEANIRKDINKLTKEINKDMDRVHTRRWHLQLDKLTKLCPRKSSQQFWKKFNQLSGNMGGSTIAAVEYKDKMASSPEDITELMAQYAEDTFQPPWRM